jgi:hypothetical protein
MASYLLSTRTTLPLPYHRSKTLKLCLIFEGFTNVTIMSLRCILVTRQEHILRLICVLHSIWEFKLCYFWTFKHGFSVDIIISINRKLKCLVVGIQRSEFLVCQCWMRVKGEHIRTIIVSITKHVSTTTLSLRGCSYICPASCWGALTTPLLPRCFIRLSNPSLYYRGAISHEI